MKVTVTARHAKFTDALKEVAYQKAHRLEHFFDHLKKIEVILADHQLKPDVGAGIARRCCGPRCPRKAGIYGRLARVHLRGKPTSTPTLTPGVIWMQAHKGEGRPPPRCCRP